MVKPAIAACTAFRFALAVGFGISVGLMPGVLVVWALDRYSQVLACPLPGDNLGTRQSATSASSVASLTGQGMGSMPMLTCVQPVPRVMVREIRPAFVPACHGVCSAAPGAEGAPLAGEESAQAAGAQALPDGNHGDNKKVAEPTPGATA